VFHAGARGAREFLIYIGAWDLPFKAWSSA
jgi:hypothetical protein